jgi:IS1 family transposase
LIVSYRLGPRDLATAYDFTHDLAERVSQRVQITTDGLRVYLEAVESAFFEDVDYAVLQKVYGAGDGEGARRYSPAKIVSSTMEVIKGTPDPKHISTSYVERLNWSTRTTNRRYTRLSNGFSRKLENHEAAAALNYFAYNFVRIHRTLRVTPAMAANVTTRLFDVSDIVALLQNAESKKAA